MIKLKRSQRGVTLTEMMLVIAVGSAIVYMSIQQYLSFRKDGDAVQVLSYANGIFQAMSGYYRDNCYGSTDTTTDPDNYTVSYGTLNPLNSTPPGNNVPINIQTSLIDRGLLDAKFIKLNPLISADSTGATGILGFYAQFNRSDKDRKICTTGTNATGPSDPACTASEVTGDIVTWKIQVSAKLNATSAEAKTAYLKILAGDCLSSPGASGLIQPCSANAPGDYVVWERLPLGSNVKADSPYWVTMPTVNQFTKMYTTTEILSLTDQSMTPNQYYLCGN